MQELNKEALLKRSFLLRKWSCAGRFPGTEQNTDSENSILQLGFNGSVIFFRNLPDIPKPGSLPYPCRGGWIDALYHQNAPAGYGAQGEEACDGLFLAGRCGIIEKIGEQAA